MRRYTIEIKEHMDNVDYFGGNRDTELRNIKGEIKAIWKYAEKYRYLGSVPESRVFTRTIETAVQKSKSLKPDDALVVKLGGPFQEVGQQEQDIGGDKQKVG